MIDERDDDENYRNPGGPSGETSRPGDANANDDDEGVEDTQCGDKGTGKGKGIKEGKGKRMVKRKGNGKGKGIVKQSPGGNDISHAVALQLEKERNKAAPDTER